MLWGESGIGKSFLAVDLSCAVATGQPWLGRQTTQTRVCYIAAEGHYTLRRRVQAWLLARGYDEARWRGRITDANFWTAVEGSPNLHEPKKLIERLTRALDGVKPGLVIVDTLAAASLGIDEQTTEGMAPVVDSLYRIRDTFDATVLVLHHTGHTNTDRARGSSSLPAALDFSMGVRYPKDVEASRVGISKNVRVLECRKQRDFSEFDPLLFTLKDYVWQPKGLFDRSKAIRYSSS